MAVMATINKINQNLARMAGRPLCYLSVNSRLADSEGRLFDWMISPDKLHPTVKAYQIWADSLKPIFLELLGPQAAIDVAPLPTGDPSARR